MVKLAAGLSQKVHSYLRSNFVTLQLLMHGVVLSRTQKWKDDEIEQDLEALNESLENNLNILKYVMDSWLQARFHIKMTPVRILSNRFAALSSCTRKRSCRATSSGLSSTVPKSSGGRMWGGSKRTTSKF